MTVDVVSQTFLPTQIMITTATELFWMCYTGFCRQILMHLLCQLQRLKSNRNLQCQRSKWSQRQATRLTARGQSSPRGSKAKNFWKERQRRRTKVKAIQVSELRQQQWKQKPNHQRRWLSKKRLRLLPKQWRNALPGNPQPSSTVAILVVHLQQDHQIKNRMQVTQRLTATWSPKSMTEGKRLWRQKKLHTRAICAFLEAWQASWMSRFGGTVSMTKAHQQLSFYEIID